MTLNFELTRNHLVVLNKAEFKYDETVHETVTKKVEPAKKEEDEDEDDDLSKNTPKEDEAQKPDEEVKTDDESAEKEDEPEKLVENEAEPESLADLVEEEAKYETETISKVVPHKHILVLNKEYHTVTLLTEEQRKEAKARIKAHDKRDGDKIKTDEARNEYESLIYEFRGWLSEDSNHVYLE